MGLLIEGRSNAEIGEELAMTPAAVGQALAGMYARLGASSRGGDGHGPERGGLGRCRSRSASTGRAASARAIAS